MRPAAANQFGPVEWAPVGWDPRDAGIPRGIAVLTGLVEAGPDDPDADLAWAEIMANIAESPQAEVEMTLGLAKLALVLLARLASDEGCDPSEVLQDIALKYRL